MEYPENRFLITRLNLWASDEKRPYSYVGAREIWLYCQDKDLPVPDEVMDVFTEGIRGYHMAYKKREEDRLSEKEEKSLSHDPFMKKYFLYCSISGMIFNPNEGKRLTLEEAFQKYETFLEKRAEKKIKRFEEKNPGADLPKHLYDEWDNRPNKDAIKRAYYPESRIKRTLFGAYPQILQKQPISGD